MSTVRTSAAPLDVTTGALDRRGLLVLWLVAAAPLAVVPGGFTRFVFAKLLLTAVACTAGATMRPSGRLPRSIVRAGVVGFAILTAAALAGDTPVASLVGRWPRYEGLPVLALYGAAAWLGARVVGRGPVRMLYVAHAMAGSALVLCAFSALDALGHSPFATGSTDRSGSLLGNATDQGLVAMMTATVILAVLLRRRDPLLLAGLAVSLVTVAVSGSRAALALTVLALLVVVLAGRRQAVRWVLVALASMVLVAVLVPTTRERLLSSATIEGRATQWRLTLRMLGDDPLLGLGPSRYVDAFGRYESADFVRFTGPATIADSPHQLFLQVASAGGVLLLGWLVVLLLLLIRRTTAVLREHPEAWGLAAASGAYGLALMVNFTAAGPTCLAAFLGGAVIAERPDREEPRWREVGQPLVLALAAVVVLMSCVSDVFLQRGVDEATHTHRRQAVSAFDSAERWRPLDGDVAMIGAQVMAGLTDSGLRSAAKDARSLAGESLSRTPDSYQSRVALAVALVAGGDEEAAREELDRAIRLFPERPDAYVQRAIVRFRLGDDVGALADLETAQGIDPRSRAVRRLLEVVRGSAR